MGPADVRTVAVRCCRNLEKALQMWFRRRVDLALLGPLEVRIDGRPVSLGGPKQRAVLALLLLHANEVVSRDRLIEGVWGEQPPSTAGRSLDSYISRLRTLLGAERIERRSPGYAIRVERGELDVQRFEDLLEQGRAALAGGDAATAGSRLDDALALWRGPPLADLIYEPFAGPHVARLEERRLLAREAHVEAGLARGRGAALVGALARLVEENPFRERLVAQLMACLYQAGRTSEALAVYQEARRRFADELGLEPSPQLRELEHQILTHDPSLAAPPTPRHEPARRPRRRVVLATAAVAVAAAATALGLALATGKSGLSATRHVIELGQSRDDPSKISDAPAAMAADDASIWVAEPNAGALVRIDQHSRGVVQRIPLDDAGTVAVGGGAVWAASVDGDAVIRIDPATGARTQTIGLGGARVTALAYGRGRIWVADVTDRELVVIDVASGTVDRTFELLVKPTALAVGARSMWIADYDAGLVTEVDARTGATLETVRVGNGPVAIALGAGAAWVANSLDSTVSKIDPVRQAVATTIPVGDYPVALAVEGPSVWVGNEYSANVSRIDVRAGSVAETARLGGGPSAMVVAGGRLWVGTRTFDRRAGGTLRLLRSVPVSVDQAVNTELGPLQAAGLTTDGLVTNNRASGTQGLQVVPDLALAIPLPADRGLTYTFHLRPGIRYSNGEPLRARDFRRGLERLFRTRSRARGYFKGIRGATACTAAHCDLSRGIVTDDATRTVTFHLTVPDPEFAARLGIFAAPVPAGTPWHAVRTTPIPGTGPYAIAQASPKEIRYVRNSFFHEWSHAAQPDGYPDAIVMRFGLSPAEEIRAIERGEADWSADGVPAGLLAEVTTRYTSQVHSYPGPDTEFLQFNTTLPPFDDVRVRRALNYAVDRTAVARAWGGPTAASPACQVLPPGVLGHVPYCPYSRHPGRRPWTEPDLATARRLVAASGTRGTEVTLWASPIDPAVQNGTVSYVVSLLRRLGYRARSHVVASLEHAPARVFRTIQMTPPGWYDTTPYGFFALWFDCDSPLNHHWFCDPSLQRGIVDAQALEATDPRSAARKWASLDRYVTDRAAWVPLVNPRGIDFVSARVGNYQHNPALGLIADQLTLR
jgi:YVTN family beta-propeller protein